MTPLAEAQAIAADMEAWIKPFEERGPQTRIRHLLHLVQAEAERMMSVAPGSIVPIPLGGIPKPTVIDPGTSPSAAS